MAIEFTTTPSETAAHVRVFDIDGNGYSVEAVQAPPDFAAQIDTIEEELLENLQNGQQVNLKDLATALVNKAKRELMGEILLRLLCVLADSDNIQVDIECLLSAGGLKIRDIPDSAVAGEIRLISPNVFRPPQNIDEEAKSCAARPQQDLSKLRDLQANE